MTTYQTATNDVQEAVVLMLDAAELTIESMNDPFAKGFAVALGAVLSANERPAAEIIASYLGDGRGDHGPGCDGPLNCTCQPETIVDGETWSMDVADVLGDSETVTAWNAAMENRVLPRAAFGRSTDEEPSGDEPCGRCGSSRIEDHELVADGDTDSYACLLLAESETHGEPSAEPIAPEQAAPAASETARDWAEDEAETDRRIIAQRRRGWESAIAAGRRELDCGPDCSEPCVGRMTAQEAVEHFGRDVIAETVDGDVIEGNNRGMALRDDRSCLAVETIAGMAWLPLERIRAVGLALEPATD